MDKPKYPKMVRTLGLVSCIYVLAGAIGRWPLRGPSSSNQKWLRSLGKCTEHSALHRATCLEVDCYGTSVYDFIHLFLIQSSKLT
ncbi:hypothetical protein XELAEV_18031949mg [Xenopus laevis]|uniref:Uncharacterized protein n=1 Tax=Xenopus laevis TaxID=8355 RepID=A0A974CNR5_XENLA|nr:hypothetical protein XELAEV_18031949mg [Xenopus laevis]